MTSQMASPDPCDRDSIRATSESKSSDEARGGRFRPTRKNTIFTGFKGQNKRTRQLKASQVLRSRLPKGLLL